MGWRTPAPGLPLRIPLLLLLTALPWPALAQELREALPQAPRFGVPGTQVRSENRLLDHPLRPPASSPPAWLSAQSDLFLTEHLSIGFAVESGLTPGALARDPLATEDNLLLRVGTTLPLAQKLDLWLRVGAGMSRLRTPELGRGESEFDLALEGSVLLMYQLQPGVHLGAGPMVRQTAAGKFVGVGLLLTW